MKAPNLDDVAVRIQPGEGKADRGAAMARRHYADGLELARAGRHEDAVACLQRAIELKHDYVDALVSLAAVHVELQQYTEAADCLNLALAFDPRSAATHAGLGDLCWRMGSGDGAIRHLLHAVEIDPQQAGPLAALGAISHAAGRHREALEYYEAASALEPQYAELHYNVALALQNLNRTQEAAARFQRATELNPDLFEAYLNAGNALVKGGEIARAIASYQRLIALKPDHAQAHNNIATAYGALGELDRALESVQKSLALSPDNPDATCNRGIILHHQGRLEEAIACYEQVRSRTPDSATAELNLGIARFMTGDFARGWAGYEWRFRANASEDRLLKHELPYRKWQGEDLAGKTILVWGEQGVGDQLLLAGLLPEISHEAKGCLVECTQKLMSLFARSWPAVSLVPITDPPHSSTRSGFDYQASLGGIGRWRRPDLGSFPRHRGYLAPEPGRVSYWQDRLAALGPGPKVGFCWRSCNTKGDRALACTDLAQWGPIFAVRGTHFVSLQYDECSAELTEAERRFGLALHVFPETDLFNDLDEAAALTRACDLVISAPTAVSMLAAALGVETWQMSYGPDWQTHGTQRNPWFPAMRRFDRRWNQSWEELIPDVAGALAERLKHRTSDH